MTNEQITYLREQLELKAIQLEKGLSEGEIEKIYDVFNIVFPKDLKLLLKGFLPISEGFPNWRMGINDKIEKENILSRLIWPLDGMIFDIENNEFWIKSWGARSDNEDERKRVARKHFNELPQLIPIYSHRYIPNRPNEFNNPIFSVYQMDIIYYGYNLANYLADEFEFTLNDSFKILEKPIREIEFWSQWT